MRIAFVLMVLAGCDGGGATDAGMDAGMEPVTVSCNNDPLYFCDQYVAAPAEHAALEAACVASAGEGEWAEGECPSASLGGCQNADGDIRYHYVEGDFFTPAEVEAHCGEEGETYVAAP